MRILHVIGWLAPRYGGTTEVVSGYCPWLAARGHEIEVVTTNVDGQGVLDVPTGRAIEWSGVAATFHPLSPPRGFLTSAPMLADLWRRIPAFDIVHIHSLYRFHTIAAAFVAHNQRIPYVIQAHGALDPWHRRQRKRAKDLYHFLIEDSNIRKATAVLCTSLQEERSIRGLGYTVPTWVVPIGIDTEALRAPTSVDDFLAAAGIEVDARIVTFLGRISVKKGVDLLVESFQRVAAQFSDTHLVVAGPDDDGIGKSLAPLITAAGMDGRISFVGPIAASEKRALLQRSDVFVLPSAGESFGIAVAEAMAVGCPVVVTPHVSIEDAVRSTGAGLVAQRNPIDIARACAAILAEPATAAVMGEAGRRLVDETFAWPGVVAKLESMYEAVVATGRAGGRNRPRLARATSEIPSRELQLICPLCRNPLDLDTEAYVCSACGRKYPLIDGIPILVADMRTIDHDEIDHRDACEGRCECGDTHKTAQAEHFDRAVAQEFETSRPRGTPRLYRFLLNEKLRRGTGPIGPHLVGASVLTVCGGSGMDAEFLARAGAHVVSSDLSLGAARRTGERARRYGLDIIPIVADIERLPFADGDFDLVFVHDGLHHLERPETGLAEMARVARCWVSVTEPARAAATAVAVKLGMALEREEAGNRVSRLSPAEIVGVLRAAGFRPLAAERYAMYYRHEPGSVFRALSRPGLFPLVRSGWRVANAVIGRAGNKMVVVAERESG